MEKEVNVNSFLELYDEFKQEDLEDRFLSFPQLVPRLEKFQHHFEVKEIGRSFLNVPIYSVQIGKGELKILAWSQMHGNETSTTRGILDLFELFVQRKNDPAIKEILESCTFLVIPMLNPDGAARYTRENANKVDLNRDAQALKEVESRVLRSCYESFQPDFCFNLHDQRTIFGAGEEGNPATLSFLAPSMDEERSVTPTREKAMKVIVGMSKALQKVIPGQVGRFDDSFNINCTGDTFQSMKVPTILFEAGHFKNDYSRNETRKLFAFSVFVALMEIVSGKFEENAPGNYEQIPENQKNFLDVVLRNAQLGEKLVDLGIQFREIVKAGKIDFRPEIQVIAADLEVYGHREIDCKGGKISSMSGEVLNENDLVSLILLNNEKLSIKTH